MGKDTTFFINMSADIIEAVGGDLALAVWYSALIGYRRVFKIEPGGFTRVSYSIVERDLKVKRMRAWRYNQKLEELGLIEMNNDKSYGFLFKVQLPNSAKD